MWRRSMPVLVPAALALLVLALGHPLRAAVLGAIAATALVLVLAGVPIDRYLARFAAAVAHAVGWVATMAVGIFLVCVGGFLRLVGVDPLTPRALQDNAWHPAPSSAAADRLSASPFGLEHGGSSTGLPESGPRVFLRRTVLVFGTVTALVLADVSIGLAWERLSSSDSAPAGQVDAVNFSGTGATVADPRADLPAMAAYPWADEYFREIQRTQSTYWPFTESRPLPFKGTYVNVDGWARSTYVAPDAGADAPVLWMFGGSTTWGEGQRDGYTIASFLARIAERAAVPITVQNFGQRGWTHFQEMILFEQLLAAGPAPDIAIFYDGANEVNAQSLSAKGVPTHTLTDDYAERISGGIPKEIGSDSEEPGFLSQAWNTYQEHSATHKVVQYLNNQLFATASADASSQRVGVAQTDVYDPTIDDAEHAVDVYQRGRTITQVLARQHGVDPVFFWQPEQASAPEVWANEHVSAPTKNISDALDAHRDVFIDGSHTNERGAGLVAQRIWQEVGPLVDRLYRARPGTKESGGSSASTTSGPVLPEITTTTVDPTTSNAAALATARSTFDRDRVDPCALERWKVWLGSLRAANPQQVSEVVGLTQEFLTALADSAPASAADGATTIRQVAQLLPAMAATAAYDPARPLIPQLPGVTDPSGGFLGALESVRSAVAGSCSTGG